MHRIMAAGRPRRRTLAPVMAALLGLLWAGADAPARAAVWTVESLASQAEHVSPSVSAGRQALAAALGAREQAGAYPNPVAGVEDAIDWKFSLVETVELPPARRARLSVSDRQVSSAELRLKAARLAVRHDVRGLAYRLLAARRRAGLIEDSIGLLERLRAALPARYQPGMKSATETLRVDLEAARARGDLSRASAEEAAVRASLNAYLLLPSSSPLELQGELAPPFADIDVPALQRRALQRDLPLLAAEAGAAEEAARLDAARASRWPTIDAGPSLNRPRESTALLGGFQASFSVPLWDRRRGDIRAAAARLEGAERDAQAQRQNTLAEIQRLGLDYLSARERARALEGQGLLEQAVKVRAQAPAAYQQGLTTLTDALDALRVSTQVQEDYIQSLLEGRQAVTDLEARLGEPL